MSLRAGSLAGPGSGRSDHVARWLSAAVVWLLGAYLLAQCFSLPLLRIGPWALWPTLPDVCLWSALGCSLLYRQPLGRGQVIVWCGLLLLSALATVSFGVLFVMHDSQLSTAVNFGLFNLYKLAQVLAVFWMVARVPLGRAVVRRWSLAASLAFVLTVVAVTWTYFSPALPTLLGAVLPRGAGVAGPWESYYLHNERGLGTTGYNHGYVALQVVLLAALPLLLRRTSPLWWLYGALLACFLSGSRSGLAGCVLLAALLWRRVPLRAGLTLLLVGIAGLVLSPLLGDTVGSLAARQETLFNPSDPSNLAGRTDIWRSYLEAFMADPYRLLIGSGFGSAINNKSNAHFLLLQVLYETGVAGLAAFGLFFSVLVSRLRMVSTPRASTVLAVLSGLGITAFSQETFYPNPAFSGFLPLLAFVVALGLTAPGEED